MATIWGAAKAIESQSRLLYERMARNAPTKDLALAYTSMARDEQRHGMILENLEVSMPPELFSCASVEVAAAEILDKLSSSYDDNEKIRLVLLDAAYGHEKALAFERLNIGYYDELRKALTLQIQNVVIDQIVSEEQNHIGILEGFLELAHRPTEWEPSTSGIQTRAALVT